MANKSRRSFIISVLACVAFVAAAVISWDLPVKHVVYYLAFILVVLFVIILVAMGFGALLSWLRRRK
ncbi:MULTISPECIES: hypothetical protein [unclassified Microbulbifer]|uniref:Uncharacterized protein n=1 Tax=Microbulbifer spongiae TaxID=2944933 RepID=A0ABY9EFY3_9GAMM|nr:MULTISPECIES: hypothetical protein [unclassified Microbulbifer]MDP5210305.1 hypothetical protein [Microbulbifer sp. 2205BS26-8]WKD50988.1 hypothetical protein M8T91_06095 [Microbulbifer sp. MI-G]